MAKNTKTSKEPSRFRRQSGKASGILTVIIAAVLTIVIGIIVLSLFGQKIKKPERTLKEISLYLGDDEGVYLTATRRKISKGSVEAEMKEALEALVDAQDGTVPEGTRVIGVKLKGATATVDFSPEIVNNHPGGSVGEILTVYSIVNTIALNFPDAKEVQILVDGKKEKTLAGHIDLSFPLTPDKKILKN